MNLTQLYLRFLLEICFNKEKYGQKISPFGQKILRYLPKPSVIWLNGVRYNPNYKNRRWLLRSFQGQHEPLLEEFILHTLKKGDNVVDVGAQVGLITVLAAKAIGPKGRVFALEPNPYNFAILNETIRNNGINNVKTFRMGAGKETGKSWFVEQTLTGYSQEPPHNIDQENDGEYLETVMLEDLVNREKIDDLSFIKIDVDGPDFEVVLGAQSLLGSDSPPMLCVECSFYWKKFGHEFKDVRSFIEGFGYIIFVALRNQDELIVLENNKTVPEGWGKEKKMAFNFFCFHPDYHSERVKPFIEKKLKVRHGSEFM